MSISFSILPIAKFTTSLDLESEVKVKELSDFKLDHVLINKPVKDCFDVQSLSLRSARESGRKSYGVTNSFSYHGLMATSEQESMFGH